MNEFVSLSFVDLCVVNVDIPAPKIGALQRERETENGDFIGNCSIWLNVSDTERPSD
jgi:hypothetical protein